MRRTVKPKSQRAKRALKKRAPKLVENQKKCIVLKGSKTSERIVEALRDLHMMKKPDAVMFNRRNQTRPFEDQTSVEFLCRKNDCSLFAFGSHSKKRPHNLILGRCFDFQVLDMFELGIDQNTFQPAKYFSKGRKAAARLGSKPCLQFVGPEWENDHTHKKFKEFLVDFFRGSSPEHLNLAGLDRMIACSTGKDGKIYFRHYAIGFKKSGSKIPRVELEEIGPSMDLNIRRTHSASTEVHKFSMKKPKQLKKRKRKNVTTGAFGNEEGRVHMRRQNLEEIAHKKFRGNKRKKVKNNDDASNNMVDEGKDVSKPVNHVDADSVDK